jgi:hypothetical protein
VINDLAGWCEQQQTILKHQLELLRAGRMRIWEQHGTGVWMVDTTAGTVDQVQNSLTELEGVLARSR